MNILQKLREYLNDNPHEVTSISLLAQDLEGSKLLEFLRSKGQARIVGIEGNVQALATEASWSNGYNECLQDILHFKEKYLLTNENPTSLNPAKATYGAEGIAIRKGYIRTEEVDKFRK